MSAPGCVNIQGKRNEIYQAAIQLLIQKRNKQGNIGQMEKGRMIDIKNAVNEAVEIYEVVEKHPAMNRISLKNKRLPKPPEPKPKFGKLKKIE